MPYLRQESTAECEARRFGHIPQSLLLRAREEHEDERVAEMRWEEERDRYYGELAEAEAEDAQLLESAPGHDPSTVAAAADDLMELSEASAQPRSTEQATSSEAAAAERTRAAASSSPFATCLAPTGLQSVPADVLRHSPAVALPSSATSVVPAHEYLPLTRQILQRELQDSSMDDERKFKKLQDRIAYKTRAKQLPVDSMLPPERKMEIFNRFGEANALRRANPKCYLISFLRHEIAQLPAMKLDESPDAHLVHRV